MTDRVADFESLLRQALVPIDPPAELEARLEETLGSLVGMAAEELDSWELSAVKDPKNWIRLARQPPWWSARARPSGSCSCARGAGATAGGWTP